MKARGKRNKKNTKKQPKREAKKTAKQGGNESQPAKKEGFDPTAYDEQDLPWEVKNKELLKNWYDFNDSCVTVIPVNRLQSQFGGSSESSYILMYRRKNLAQPELLK